MRILTRFVFTASVLWAGAGLALAAETDASAPAEKTVEEIISCVTANTPVGDELRSVRLISSTPNGQEIKQAQIFQRRAENGDRRVLIRFSEPEELEGSSVLIAVNSGEPEVHFHSPEMRTPRRLTGVEADTGLFGTDLSYEDLLQLQGTALSEADRVERLADDRISEWPVYVLESRPLAAHSAYERIVFSIDRENCVARQATFFEAGRRQPRKVLIAQEIEQVDEIWLPHRVTIKDYRDQTDTTLLLETMHRNVLPEGIKLNPEELGKFKPKIELVAGELKPRVEFEPIKLALDE